MTPYIPKDLKGDLEELLYECYKDTGLFCKTFMPESFSKPFSPDHLKLFEALDDPTIQKLAIAAPRGFGKTTIFNKAYPIKRIVYQDTKYMVPVSAAGLAAREYSENLKNELLENTELTDIFGPIRSETSKGPFSTQEWVTATGIKVLPRGAGQQIRGRQFKNFRPDLYVIDDLEDDESVENEELRDKLKRWFFSSVVNSVELSSTDWRIIVIGTVLHEDSLLANLLDDKEYPEWKSMTFELCDENLKSKWPEHLSDEKIKELHDDYKRKGLLDIFYKEFRNVMIPVGERGFKQDYFSDYTESEQELNTNPNIETMILADIARTTKAKSTYSVVLALSVDVNAGKYYVRDIVKAKMDPGELIAEMLDMGVRCNAIVLAPEVTGLQEYAMYPLTNEMLRRGLHFIIIPINPRERKTGPKRSGGLIPMYRQGLFKHNSVCCTHLEEMLLAWPKSKSWDEIDALSGCIYVLEEGERYFSPKELSDPEEEFNEIEYEEPLVYEDIA